VRQVITHNLDGTTDTRDIPDHIPRFAHFTGGVMDGQTRSPPFYHGRIWEEIEATGRHTFYDTDFHEHTYRLVRTEGETAYFEVLT